MLYRENPSCLLKRTYSSQPGGEDAARMEIRPEQGQPRPAASPPALLYVLPLDSSHVDKLEEHYRLPGRIKKTKTLILYYLLFVTVCKSNWIRGFFFVVFLSLPELIPKDKTCSQRKETFYVENQNAAIVSRKKCCLIMLSRTVM